MSIHQKRKKWFVSISRGKVEGKYVSDWYGGFETESEALEVERKIKEGSFQTVGKWLDAWLKEKKTSIAPKTYKSYYQTVEKHLKPMFGKVELSAVNRHHVFTLQDNLDHLSPTSVAYIQKVFSQAMKAAMLNDMVSSNPVATVKPPRKNPPHVPLYDGKAVEKLLANVPDYMVTLILLAYTTGLRRGEINALTWSNVDMKTRHIRVMGSTGEYGYGPTKTKKTRSVYMMQKLYSHLEQIFERYGLVIPKSKDPYWVTKAFRYWADLNDMQGFRFHDLRHIHATELLEAGVHPKIVQERLGHSTIRTTLDIYSHAVVNLQEKELRSVDEIIERGKESKKIKRPLTLAKYRGRFISLPSEG